MSALIYVRCYGFAGRPACLSVYICRLDAEEKRTSISTEMAPFKRETVEKEELCEGGLQRDLQI